MLNIFCNSLNIDDVSFNSRFVLLSSFDFESYRADGFERPAYAPSFRYQDTWGEIEGKVGMHLC